MFLDPQYPSSTPAVPAEYYSRQVALTLGLNHGTLSSASGDRDPLATAALSLAFPSPSRRVDVDPAVTPGPRGLTLPLNGKGPRRRHGLQWGGVSVCKARRSSCAICRTGIITCGAAGAVPCCVRRVRGKAHIRTRGHVALNSSLCTSPQFLLGASVCETMLKSGPGSAAHTSVGPPLW